MCGECNLLFQEIAESSYQQQTIKTYNALYVSMVCVESCMNMAN